jgi:transposase
LLSELGDTRRFSSSKKAVRYAGMDVTVHSSDEKRAAGKLSRQGPPVLRWAAFEVAKRAWRKGSPDHDYYLKNKERIGAGRAALSIARKLILAKLEHTTPYGSWERRPSASQHSPVAVPEIGELGRRRS